VGDQIIVMAEVVMVDVTMVDIGMVEVVMVDATTVMENLKLANGTQVSLPMETMSGTKRVEATKVMEGITAIVMAEVVMVDVVMVDATTVMENQASAIGTQVLVMKTA